MGTYNGKSAQGMAIYRNKAYLFNDGGGCRVFDLKSGTVIDEFQLASASEKTHINTACFRTTTVNGNTMLLLYSSECSRQGRCFVECIKGDSSSILLQSIAAKKNNKRLYVPTWILDNQNEALYAIVRRSPIDGEAYSKKVEVFKYRLPALSEGENIVLTENDCFDSFMVEFENVIQGGKIKGNYMYIVSGFQEVLNVKHDAKRAIQVIDLKKKELVRSIDLTYVTTNEPEDMDFYKGKALLYTGQNGGLYKMKVL